MEHQFSRIEHLFIVSTVNGTRIDNFDNKALDYRSHNIYSVIEVIPDESRSHIKTIKGLYNYGKKINDKYRCSFDLMNSENNPLNVIKSHGNTLVQKIQSYFNNILLNSSHNSVLLQGLNYPGATEQQKFVNAFCSGLAVTLIMYQFMKQADTNNNNKDSLVSMNPLYPLNLCFGSHSVNVNLLNKNFYHYITYYIHVCKDKFGRDIEGLAIHWLDEMNKFWSLFENLFIDAEPADNLIAIHASTIGFATFFEERVYKSWNRISSESTKSISTLNENYNALFEELKEMHVGYLHALKDQSTKTEEVYSSYARQLSSKFSDFNEFVDDAADQYQRGMEEIKIELRGHIEKNKEDLIEDIAKTWNTQLDDISMLTKAINRDIEAKKNSSILNIESSSSAMIDTAVVRIRSEVETVIDQLKNTQTKLMEDLNNAQLNSKSEIFATVKRVENDSASIMGSIEHEKESLIEYINNKENDQLKAADSLLEYINESKVELESLAVEAVSNVRDATQSATNEEFESLVKIRGHDLVGETFNKSLDEIAPNIHKKINDKLDDELNPIIRNTIRQVNSMRQTFENESNAKISTIKEIQKFIDEHENKVPSYQIIEKIQKEWNEEKEKIRQEREQWSSYIEKLSKKVELLEGIIRENGNDNRDLLEDK